MLGSPPPLADSAVAFILEDDLSAGSATLVVDNIPQTADHLFYECSFGLEASGTGGFSTYITVNSTASYDVVAHFHVDNVITTQGYPAGIQGKAKSVGALGLLNDTDVLARGLHAHGFIPFYTQSDFFPIIHHRVSARGGGVTRIGHTANSVQAAAAITKITVSKSGGNDFAAGSILRVWGLRDAVSFGTGL